jgi:hypothetical protein
VNFVAKKKKVFFLIVLLFSLFVYRRGTERASTHVRVPVAQPRVGL